jgi:hypothetical protein
MGPLKQLEWSIWISASQAMGDMQKDINNRIFRASTVLQKLWWTLIPKWDISKKA